VDVVRFMADYYSLLSRAVSNLPKSSPASARRAIYDRARKALIGQLRSLKPPLPESDIAREENALDVAVKRLEAEFESAPAASPAPAAPPAPPTSPPARPVAPSRPQVTPPRPAPPLKAPTLGFKGAAAAPSGSAPVATAPTSGAAPVAAAPALGAGAGAARPVVPPRPAPPPPPRSAGALVASFAAGLVGAKGVPETNAAAPPVSAATVEATGPDNAPRIGSPLEVDPPRADADPPRPGAPGRAGLGRSNPWPWVALAVAVGLVLSIAGAAFYFRERPQDLAIKEPVEPTTTASPAANGQKIVERVGNAPASAPSDTPSPSPSPAQSPSTTASAVPAPTAGPTAVPAPTASPTAAPAPSAAGAASTVAAVLPVTARAAMLVATAADAQKPAVTIGTVVWSAAPALPGQPGSGGVKADIDIPDLKMHASMTLRKNTDAALPASHTIDLRLIFDEGSSIKGVKDIDLPRMRRDESPNADPLLGVKVKINDSYFLIGLNRADADVARNVDEIATRGWFDFPLLLNDDRIAKLTFEKATDGDRVVNDALAAWK
jgi:hypothetical protein